MPQALLPASAQAFAPRSGPTIVLGNRVETWLTHSLKRINRVKRPLNSVSQHYRCLTETLSGPAALWTLSSLMLPKAPDAELKKDSNPLIEAIFNYQLIHVEAYVVHVDMVSQNEVAFKLTQDSIDALIDYHKDIYSVDVAANTWDWSEKEQQLKKLQQDFVQAINRYVYRTHVRALEGLEDDGAGELLEGRSEEVKNAIMGLFLPLLPPPPRIEYVHPFAAQQHQMHDPNQWWQQQQQQPIHSPNDMQGLPMEPWRVLGSTPSPSATSAPESMSNWSGMGFNNDNTAVTSPTSAYSQHTSPSPFAQHSQPVYEQPNFTQASQDSYTETTQGMTSAEDFFSQSVMTPASLPMPSVLAGQCGASAGPLGGYADNYGWGNGNQMMQPFQISI